MPRLICCECDQHFSSTEILPVCHECQDAEADMLETLCDYVPEKGKGKFK